MRKPSRRLRRRHVTAVALLVAAFAAVIAKGLRRSRFRGPAPARGAVRRVIDGDTFDLANGARIRLLDIDAPEFDEGTREMAQRATDALGELCARRTVRLEYGPRVRDRYGRFLAYCFVEPRGEPVGGAPPEPRRPDGVLVPTGPRRPVNDVVPTGPRFVNVELVRSGLARVYAGRGHGPRYDDVLAAEREARAAGRGIWASVSRP